MIEADGRSILAAPGVGGARVVIGIGEMAIGNDGGSIVTHALGSCVAVCLFDPVSRVGGLLHFLLPESRINPSRARMQPCAFADLGIPMLFQQAYARGLLKASSVVKLVGGAEVTGDGGAGSLGVGKRNALAARSILWRNGVLVRGEALGGSVARTVRLSLVDGQVEITNGRDHVGSL